MRFRAIIAAAAFAVSLACSPASHAESEKFYVPPTQFNAALQVMDRGFSNVFGMFQAATGSFLFDAGNKTISRVRIALDASSLMIPNQSVRLDLAALLAPMKYPEIAFAAASPATFKDGKAEIKGTLTLHGVSKPFAFEATLNNEGKTQNGGSLWNDESSAVGLSLQGTVKRADFDMGDPAEEPGRFGDTIQLRLEMQAMRQ